MNINIQGSISVVNFNAKATSTFNSSLTMVGNNYVALAVNIPTGSWTVLGQGSNADFRTGVFTNNDATSSIYIGLGGTGSYAAILQPDDSALLTYSGSVIIYAKAVGGSSPAILDYTLASYN